MIRFPAPCRKLAALLTASLFLANLTLTGVPAYAQENAAADSRTDACETIQPTVGATIETSDSAAADAPAAFAASNTLLLSAETEERTIINVPYLPMPDIPVLFYTLNEVFKYDDSPFKNNPGAYDLILTESQASDSGAHPSLSIASGYNVRLMGQSGSETLTAEAGPLFTVEKGGTLTISNLTLDANGKSSLIKVEEGGTLILEDGAVLKNCTGSAILNEGTLIMNGGMLTGNDTQQQQNFAGNGAVFNGAGATFTMTGGSITQNGKVGSSAGGQSSTRATGTASDGYAGGVTNLGTFTMTGGEITDNVCASLTLAGTPTAGGVCNLGTFTLKGTGVIARNTNSLINYAGGVYNGGNARFTLTGDAEIYQNVAQHSGGGVYNNGIFTMDGGSIHDHSVEQFGGGVYNSVNGTFTMNAGSITQNTARGDYSDALNGSTGGGVFNSGTFTMHGGEISWNHAAKGGGIQSGIDTAFTGGRAEAVFTMDGGTINHNTADANGGGLFVYTRSVATITAGRIEYNTANGENGGGYSGGGIYINQSTTNEAENGTLYLYNAVIRDNTSILEGSGVAACPYSNVQIYMTDGGAIFENQSNNSTAQPQIYVAAPDTTPNRVHKIELSKYMLGGGMYHWTDAQGTPLTDDQLQNARTLSAYNAITGDSAAAQAALQKATVWITNNYSADRGGGIGCNGNLYFGKGPDKDFGSLTIQKAVNGQTDRTDFAFTLSLKTPQGTPYNTDVQGWDGTTLRALTPDAQGSLSFSLQDGQNWEFIGLPAGTLYTVTEAPLEDCRTFINGQKGNSFSGQVEADTALTLTVLNDYTPEPTPTPSPSASPSTPVPSPSPSSPAAPVTTAAPSPTAAPSQATATPSPTTVPEQVSAIPQTGDESDLTGLVILAVVSGGLFLLLARKRVFFRKHS